MCKCSEDLEILLAALKMGDRPNPPNPATDRLLKALLANEKAIMVAFPAIGAAAINHVKWLLDPCNGGRINNTQREIAIAEIKAKTECGCAAKPSPALETNLRCMIKSVLEEATESTGAEGMCAVEEMMTRAKRISAQRKFLFGLYDMYVNAALASGLPNNLLPSAVSGRGGQDGGDPGGRPTAP